MAKKAGVNPTSATDPRFDPPSDDANAVAHGEKPKRKSKADKARIAEVQSLVTRSLERALDHYEEHLEPDQKLATDYYLGRAFGDEEDGRSKVVSTDVRDATRSQLPSLMRIFFGPEKAVEFRPRGLEDTALAEQQTDFVNMLIREENPGFLILYSAFKDALVRRLGWVKWWQDTKYRVEATNYTGLDEQGVLKLLLDPDLDVEVTGVAESEDGQTYDVRATRRESEGCPRFAAVPPEEMVFTPDARDLDSAPLVAHVREVPREDLIALGIDPELIDEHAGKQRARASDDLEDARQLHGGSDWEKGEDERDSSQKPVLFAETYMLVDGDGDDIAELRLFQCVGPSFVVANGDGMGEIVDEIPFAVFTPEPEPHTIVGLSNFDLLKDVQRVKSQVQRGMLNSLALSLEQKQEVVVGEVNMQDLVNPEIVGIVRVNRPGMLREIGHTFIGPETLSVLDHYDRVKEERTGITKASQGLDADSLQSSTKAAVAGTFAAAQQQIEMIARVFAETGMRRLMKGLLGLTVKHQSKARVVRLRGQYVEIDPRHWDATMDVSVNIGLGQGTTEDRINAIREILAAHATMKQMGAPFIQWTHTRAALAKATELLGLKPDEFFGPWTAEDEAQMQQQMANQPPPPDPNMALVQIEGMKAQGQMQMEAQRLELERWKIQLQDDREREKIAREAALKELELELKHAVEIEDVRLAAKVAADRAAMDADVKREQIRNQPTGGAE